MTTVTETVPLIDETGARVYAALTPADRARLRAAIRRAIESIAPGDEGDDWLCALGNSGHWPHWKGRVTNELLREACTVLAEAKAGPCVDADDWHRLLSGAFGSEHARRFEALYAEVPFGAELATTTEH